MAEYRLAQDGVIRTSDLSFIPDERRNRDWRKYQRWLGDGNTPDPAAPARPPKLDRATVQADLEAAIAAATGIADLKNALLGIGGTAKISGRET